MPHVTLSHFHIDTGSMKKLTTWVLSETGTPCTPPLIICLFKAIVNCFDVWCLLILKIGLLNLFCSPMSSYFVHIWKSIFFCFYFLTWRRLGIIIFRMKLQEILQRIFKMKRKMYLISPIPRSSLPFPSLSIPFFFPEQINLSDFEEENSYIH